MHLFDGYALAARFEHSGHVFHLQLASFIRCGHAAGERVKDLRLQAPRVSFGPTLENAVQRLRNVFDRDGRHDKNLDNQNGCGKRHFEKHGIENTARLTGNFVQFLSFYQGSGNARLNANTRSRMAWSFAAMIHGPENVRSKSGKGLAVIDSVSGMMCLPG